MRTTDEQTWAGRRSFGQRGCGCGHGCGCGGHARGPRWADGEETVTERVTLEERQRDLEQELADVTARLRHLS
jgi:hypothetical protein